MSTNKPVVKTGLSMQGLPEITFITDTGNKIEGSQNKGDGQKKPENRVPAVCLHLCKIIRSAN